MTAPRRLLRLLLKPLWRSRRIGLATEEYFWWKYLRTRGSRWPDEFNRRLDVNRPLTERVAACVNRLTSDTVRILDVGAGPLTSIGYVAAGRLVEITAVDVLAGSYDRMLARRGIVPPVPTLYADAERLSDRFGAETFNLVHAQNSLDHAENPQRAIEQMIQVTKPGGIVLLIHAENEAENEDYAGLHQWNLCENNGDFILWNRSNRINMTELIGPACCTRTWREEKSVIVEITKQPDDRRA